MDKMYIEVANISAEDLRINRRLVKKNTFVTIRSDSTNSASTNVDTEGGSSPIWTEKLHLSVPLGVRSITVEVQCKNGSGSRTIGAANIPVSDFVADHIPLNYLHFLSYRLRDHNGERNGIVNLSIRVKGGADSVPRLMLKPGAQDDCRSTYGGNGNIYSSLLPSSSQGPALNISSPVAIGIPVSYSSMA